MSRKIISTGEHANGQKWRIERCNGLYYYDIELIEVATGAPFWQNIARNFDLAPMLETRNNDAVRIAEYVRMKKGGC